MVTPSACHSRDRRLAHFPGGRTRDPAVGRPGPADAPATRSPSSTTRSPTSATTCSTPSPHAKAGPVWPRTRSASACARSAGTSTAKRRRRQPAARRDATASRTATRAACRCQDCGFRCPAVILPRSRVSTRPARRSGSKAPGLIARCLATRVRAPRRPALHRPARGRRPPRGAARRAFAGQLARLASASADFGLGRLLEREVAGGEVSGPNGRSTGPRRRTALRARAPSTESAA